MVDTFGSRIPSEKSTVSSRKQPLPFPRRGPGPLSSARFRDIAPLAVPCCLKSILLCAHESRSSRGFLAIPTLAEAAVEMCDSG